MFVYIKIPPPVKGRGPAPDSGIPHLLGLILNKLSTALQAAIGQSPAMETEPSYEELKESGNDSFRRGDYKEAIQWFTRAIGLHPNEVALTSSLLSIDSRYTSRSSIPIAVYAIACSSNGREVYLMRIKLCRSITHM